MNATHFPKQHSRQLHDIIFHYKQFTDNERGEKSTHKSSRERKSERESNEIRTQNATADNEQK
jgi:hypothetical protein